MSEHSLTVAAAGAIAFTAYHLTAALIPRVGPDFVKKGLGGRDMLKKGFTRAVDGSGNGGKMLPEAMGVIAASVYILLLSLFAPLPYLSYLLPPNEPPPTIELKFPHHSFATYLASLLSLLTATFLGFLDDVFDIRWRYKIPIPIIASVPLLVTYAAGHGITDIVLPKLFGIRHLFGIEETGGVLHLGPLYYVYMSMLSTFCTNSINILAGINGVEVGQALVIALSIALNDLLFLTFDLSLLSPSRLLPLHLSPTLLRFVPESVIDLQGSKEGNGTDWLVGIGMARGSRELADRHLFSIYFMLPLIGVCFGLLKHNWYPARSFIGDTFCYFSGMLFATVGILGHFSKTLLLFFLPQIFNFLYSSPQLFGILPCPRHRLPHFNEKTGLLEPSYAILSTKPSPLLSSLLLTLYKLGLIDLKFHPSKPSSKRTIKSINNLTIINLVLVRFGSMREDKLTSLILGIQVMGSVVAFLIRYGGSQWFYDATRR